MTQANAPLPMSPAPDPIDQALTPLLAEPFASAWAASALNASTSSLSAATTEVRGRLLERLAASQAQMRPMVTARRARIQPRELASGVHETLLYSADPCRDARPGEPTLARLIDLAPGTSWAGPATSLNREWLVIRGAIHLGSQKLEPRDYHLAPAGTAAQPISSAEGACVFLRESACPADENEGSLTVRDQDAGWPDFAPGIQRRVLWSRQGQAAMLYYAQPGASVPHHNHGHDEECLMVQGELFLDDVLLQEGDYQLAPVGTGHKITATDTGVVIYAHGDLDLQFVG